jgi:hypothetical protein
MRVSIPTVLNSQAVSRAEHWRLHSSKIDTPFDAPGAGPHLRTRSACRRSFADSDCSPRTAIIFRWAITGSLQRNPSSWLNRGRNSPKTGERCWSSSSRPPSASASERATVRPRPVEELPETARSKMRAPSCRGPASGRRPHRPTRRSDDAQPRCVTARVPQAVRRRDGRPARVVDRDDQRTPRTANSPPAPVTAALARLAHRGDGYQSCPGAAALLVHPVTAAPSNDRPENSGRPRRR